MEGPHLGKVVDAGTCEEEDNDLLLVVRVAKVDQLGELFIRIAHDVGVVQGGGDGL